MLDSGEEIWLPPWIMQISQCAGGTLLSSRSHSITFENYLFWNKILCTMSAAHGAMTHCYEYFSNRLDLSTEMRWTHVMSSNNCNKIHLINKLILSFKSIYNISSFIAPAPLTSTKAIIMSLSPQFTVSTFAQDDNFIITISFYFAQHDYFYYFFHFFAQDDDLRVFLRRQPTCPWRFAPLCNWTASFLCPKLTQSWKEHISIISIVITASTFSKLTSSSSSSSSLGQSRPAAGKA